MNLLSVELLLRVLVAHFLADFVFQSSTMAKAKDELAYLLVTIPTGVLIGKVTESWSKEIERQSANGQKSGLKNAGKWIGMLERTLILTFVIAGKMTAIGFLLAAKSVFRFGDLKDATDHKKTEYIIIGTLLSFVVAIGTGLVYRLAF